MAEQAAADIWSMTPQQAGDALAALATPKAPDQGSPEEARAALDAKLNDPAWYLRFSNGSPDARAEFEKLLEHGGADKVDRIIAQTADVHIGETVVGGEISTYNQMMAAAALLESGVTPEHIKLLLTDQPLSRSDFEIVLRTERQALGNPDFVKRYLAGEAEPVRLMNTIKIHKVRGFKDEAA